MPYELMEDIHGYGIYDTETGSYLWASNRCFWATPANAKNAWNAEHNVWSYTIKNGSAVHWNDQDRYEIVEIKATEMYP
jgi:hypothetical protein